MSEYNKKNPSHGRKVTTDPACRSDFKREYAGPIASDSLAAESLRSGGHFSEGNPVGISSVTGSHSTFTGHPEDSGAHFEEIKPGHKKGDQDHFETGKLGGMDEDMKTKAARVGILGGYQTPEEYTGGDYSGQDDHPRLGLRGGMAPVDSDNKGESGDKGLSSSKYAPSTTTHAVGTVGNEEVKRREQPDWSKISKDTTPTTNIGGPDDPGRAAAEKFSARQQGAEHVKSGGAVREEDLVKGDEKNRYQNLNDNETI